MTSYTWNATNWTGDTGYWPLTNSNKTATRAGGSGVIPIKTNESDTTGTVVEKFTYTGTPDGSSGFGIVNGSWTNGNTTVGDANSVFYESDGTGDGLGGTLASGSRLPGSSPANPPFTSGSTYWIEVNFTAKTIRISPDGSTWGNTTDITSLLTANGTVYFACWSYVAGEVFTLSEPTGGGASATSATLMMMGV